jgi:hypothetical protein
MTIFGFNTDVKQGSTVYHVQSEARRHEELLQTQVFVRGRCIGKHDASYGARKSLPDFSEQQLEALLREQHKVVLDAVREGRMDEVLRKPDPPKGLRVRWVEPDQPDLSSGLLMRLVVTDGEEAVSGARVTSRLKPAHGPAMYAQGTTDQSGTAELRLPLTSLPEVPVLVQATHAGRVATRKFRLRKPR